MAFSITTTIPIISPIYTPLEFVMADPSATYMELDIYIGDSSKGQYEGTLRTLKLVANSLTVDIQGIVQPFFQSDASGTVQLKRIDVVGRTFVNNVSTNVYVNNYYLFNGVNRSTWNPSEYILDNSGEAKFLNNFNADINIHWQDKDTKLFLFQGEFTNSTGTYACSSPKIRVKRDGVLSSGYQIPSDTTPRITAFNICPSTLNSLIPDLNITSTTKTYTVDPSQNALATGLKTINIVNKDDRYTPKRVAFVDSMGCINYFNFDLAQTNTVEVNRSTYNNNGTLKQYNNKAADVYTITSNWITEKESLALKDLWYSPSVMVDGQYVILKIKSMDIKKRRDVKLINYVCEYEIAREYVVQMN